jgi:sialate O-acetylesterase
MDLHAAVEKLFKMSSYKKIYLLIFMLPFCCFSQFKLDKYFSDNMMFQCEKPIRIFGKGIPGKKITLHFSSKDEIKKEVQKDSTWVFNLPSQKYTSTQFDFTVSDETQQKSIKNILIGDVWICTGQSNMEFPLSNDLNFQGNKSFEFNPLIRIYNPTYVGKDFYGKPFSDSMKQRLTAGDYYEGGWELADFNASARMSAIGYYFGKNIQHEVGIPIGIINISVGGSPIEAWMNPESFTDKVGFKKKVDKSWITNDQLPVWVRQRAFENIGSTDQVHGFMPGYIFNTGILPLMQFSIKGILWYQGESNAQELDRVNEYAELMKMMVTDYRRGWNEKKLPFYFVQLSSIDTLKYKSHFWPLFRSNQLKSHQQIKYSGMVVSSDLGDKDNVHPRDKRTVADRLALWSLNDVYKKKTIVSGPIPRKANFQKNKVVVEFNFSEELHTADKKSIRGFSLNGIDQVDASIKNNKI